MAVVRRLWLMPSPMEQGLQLKVILDTLGFLPEPTTASSPTCWRTPEVIGPGAV
jgi:hypothetical protein